MFLLKRIKKDKNITNKKMAEILGTTCQFASSLNHGIKKLNINHIKKIFEAIEFSEEEKEKILLEFYLEDAPSDFKEKIFEKLKKETI
ncbi:MAG: hypothetical protein ACRC4T_24155 [Cetobacterium sp.]